MLPTTLSRSFSLQRPGPRVTSQAYPTQQRSRVQYLVGSTWFTRESGSHYSTDQDSPSAMISPQPIATIGRSMAHLEWLAAALSPSDIAPHPNFFSTEQITEVSIFALVCTGRWSDIER